ncbi:hypothetical protein CBF45_07340 [Bordetella sp. J329]|nr:hypothetical protein CBF45_07340 [Bordetella sp. J329]
MNIEIQSTKPVWVAWTNTDLTEGRGHQIPLAVAETKETAVRIGKRRYVMGSDCPVTESMAVEIKGQWLIPGVIHAATKEDKAAEDARLARQSAVERAKAAGLSDADIEALREPGK